MKNIIWLDGNRIQIVPPYKTKKVTGTRFATILGLNPWSTEFEIWCAITKLWEKEFEDTIYTKAGKTIEPKQADYMVKAYGMNLITPANMYGLDYFNKTRGDFFPDNKHFGGMWDYLAVDESGNINTVLEMKTTKRIEDWQRDAPEYYALQAALYAWLLGVDNVIMVASFLEENDYSDPSKFIPNINNTITVEFKMSERYPDFSKRIAEVEQWWKEHVDTGISPIYDEKKDAEILKALRTQTLTPDDDINALIAEAEELTIEVNKVTNAIASKQKRLKELNDIIKEYAINQFHDGDSRVEINGSHHVWTLSRSNTVTVDKDRLMADGLFDKYAKKAITYRLTVR